MNYARETIQKAFKIYQEKYGGSLVEVSILFVNVMDALDEAAEQGVPRTGVVCWGCTESMTVVGCPKHDPIDDRPAANANR